MSTPSSQPVGPAVSLAPPLPPVGTTSVTRRPRASNSRTVCPPSGSTAHTWLPHRSYAIRDRLPSQSVTATSLPRPSATHVFERPPSTSETTVTRPGR